MKTLFFLILQRGRGQEELPNRICKKFKSGEIVREGKATSGTFSCHNRYYHSRSLYRIPDFDWLIHLQITACKYRSAANNWCKSFIEHAHFENASSAAIKKYLSFKLSTWLVLPSYQKANCPLY